MEESNGVGSTAKANISLISSSGRLGEDGGYEGEIAAMVRQQQLLWLSCPTLTVQQRSDLPGLRPDEYVL